MAATLSLLNSVRKIHDCCQRPTITYLNDTYLNECATIELSTNEYFDKLYHAFADAIEVNLNLFNHLSYFVYTYLCNNFLILTFTCVTIAFIGLHEQNIFNKMRLTKLS